MRRRDFVGLVGGAAAWPLAAGAQQRERMRRVSLITQAAENQPGTQAAIAAFRESLAKLGWIEGRNLLLDLRYGDGDAERIQAHAAELVRLAPDVIVTGGAFPTRASQQQTQTIPIVMTGAGDPVRFGLVG